MHGADDINRRANNNAKPGGSKAPEDTERAEQKPQTFCGDLHNLPAALAPLIALPHWVLWRWEKAGEKFTKVPYQPSGRKAKNNDPTTWNSYDVVLKAMADFDGIGFCLFNSDIAAFDIDHCRNSTTGVIDSWAADLVERVASYTEITVSGTGLRIIGLGNRPKLHRKLPATNGVSLEVYRRAERYIVIAGNPLNGSTNDIVNIDEHLDATVVELEAKKTEQNKPGSAEDGGHHAQQEVEDEDKLERIIRDGESGEFKGDRSSAVWWVVCEMLRRGYADRAIVSTLLDRNNKISDHVNAQPQPRKYAERQVVKAKEKIPSAKVEVLPESQWFGDKAIVPPPALIKGLLPQTGVGMLGGQSRVGKTFIALNLACCLIPACNQQHFIDRYHVKRKGGVLYLVLEGKPAFPLRVAAAFESVLPKQMRLGDRYRLPFSWNTYEPNLFDKGPDGLIKLVERDAQRMRQDFGVDPVIVFLDTMGLAACYENENYAAQIQKVVSGLNHASDATGAFFMGIDHYGKDQGAGLRGSSAKVAHVETVLAGLVDIDDNDVPSNRRLKLEKIRDGEDGRIIPYRLQVVDMGRDDDGSVVDTCIVKWEPGRPMPLKRGRRKQKTDITLEMAIDEVGLPAEVEALRTAFYKHHGGGDKAANMAWHRATNGKLVLINGGLDYPK